MSKRSKKSKMRRIGLALQVKRMETEKTYAEMALAETQDELKRKSMKLEMLSKRLEKICGAVCFDVHWDALLCGLMVRNGKRSYIISPKGMDCWKSITVYYSEYDDAVEARDEVIRSDDGYMTAYQQSDGTLIIPEPVGCYHVFGFDSWTRFKVIKTDDGLGGMLDNLFEHSFCP